MSGEQDFSASLKLSPEQLEAGRLLFAGPCEFFYGAQQIGQLPDPAAPEVAFAGRSNVGKSSLINALTGRKSLARASSEPGRTKQLNFFDLDGQLVLVDMPGYGFAKAAKAVKEDWQGMMFDYLRGRPNLRRVILLLDARIETKASDRDVMDMFDKAAINFQVVLTKCDDVKPKAEEARYREVVEEVSRHPAAHPLVLRTSSQTGLGIPELRAEIAAFAEPVQN
ncbi:MAG: ribosome biogenesis GTP-binding protein YihA/YsxC [Acetobacter sp.]|uniref:Probable GTP-binding protein EngB n=1 Tax=Acetobacter aceti NBRC 14818 TaxID=887700 RepID=A0AB33IJR1_ACEAC|nr:MULTISPECIES: ribosome biogenesis GTP-binding protein YihA/YsxC [Acetobacter]TCS34624.1 GTP-binding protein [Acetobacter aceti NBRC 14818]BCK77049.1 putative GTP-binding protein EngB [Acetobacter aceti NBRC 14818]GAN56490.1 ribosome biogenesis GTP-binding protein YsxC [Acetobacter aceti NBRC 14818]GBO79540.1 ribosome biogenesis GTP-binding protein YsxC [Acetobacter aceti NRIC 0242]